MAPARKSLDHPRDGRPAAMMPALPGVIGVLAVLLMIGSTLVLGATGGSQEAQGQGQVAAQPGHLLTTAPLAQPGAALLQSSASLVVSLVPALPLACDPNVDPTCTPAANLTNNQCNAPVKDSSVNTCYGLLEVVRAWTRWLAWIIGGVGVIWVLAGFFRASEAQPGFMAEGPWKRLMMRTVEAGIVFYIAWRIGDIAYIIETILYSHSGDSTASTIWTCDDCGSTSSSHTYSSTGLWVPPHGAIAELLGLVMGVLVQVFLMFIFARIAWQLVAAIGATVSERVGSIVTTNIYAVRMAIISSVAQLVALAIAMVYAPSFLIWIISFLAS